MSYENRVRRRLLPVLVVGNAVLVASVWGAPTERLRTAATIALAVFVIASVYLVAVVATRRTGDDE
ncbi:hypothetical protein AB0A73_21415 [Glycomyces sp. NPDC047369]